MTGKVQPIGDCYRWAYHYVLKHPDALLYQGRVVAPLSDDPAFLHAWATHKGIVKDWQTMVAGFGGKFRGKGYPEAVYAELWQPSGVKVFNKTEALVASARAGHYGPW